MGRNEREPDPPSIIGRGHCCQKISSRQHGSFVGTGTLRLRFLSSVDAARRRFMKEMASTATIIASIAVAIVLILMVPKGLHDPADNPIVSADGALPSTAIQGP